MEETESTVRSLMTAVLGKEIPESGDVVRTETPKWDSLKHVELIFTIEDEFGMSFEGEQLNELNSLSSIVKALDAQAS